MTGQDAIAKEAPRSFTVEVYEDTAGEHRWRIINDQNGQNVGGNQEGNKKRSHVVDMVEAIFEGALYVTLAHQMPRRG